MKEKRFALGVDPGKGFVDFVKLSESGEFVHNSFVSKYTKTTGNNKTILGEDSYNAVYKDEGYVLGVQGETDLRHIRTKKDPIHRLFTLVAITKMLGDTTDGAIVDLVVTMPSGSFTNEDEVKEFNDYYKGEGEISIVVNDIEYNFTIDRVVSMPEAAGFSFRYPELLVGNSAVIDIGHLNINILTFKDNNITKMISLDQGGKELETLIVQELESELGEEIRDEVIIDTIFRGHYTRYGSPVESTKDIIKNVKAEYIEKIIKLADAKGVDLSIFDNIFFIGGTSLLMKSSIEDHKQLQNTANVLSDAKTISVIGSFIFALSEFGAVDLETVIDGQDDEKGEEEDPNSKD